MSDTRDDTWREAAATALRAVGALLIACGLTIAYAERAVFDPEAFAARAAASLEDPRVADYVANVVTDQLIAQKRDLTAYRPVIVATTRTLVASEAFRVAFRRGVAGAHAVALSEGAERVYLSLPDVSVLLRSALAHSNPEALAKIPPDLRTLIASGRRGGLSEDVLAVLRLGHRFRNAEAVALSLGPLALVAGVALSRRRRVALLRGAATLACLALLVFLLPSGLRLAATWSVEEPGRRALFAGLTDAFAGGLQQWALLLAGIGLVLAAAASSLASHVEVEDFLLRAWNALQRPARTARGELLRASALISLGVLTLVWPLATLRLAAVVFGGLLAFEGLRELFVVLAPRLESEPGSGDALAGARERREAEREARAWPRLALVAALALTLAGAGALLLRRELRREERARPQPAVTACNGSAALCGLRLDQVVLAGAHNAMSAADLPGWMFPNQDAGIGAQLRAGIRALLFDVHGGVPVAGRIKTDLADEASARRKFERALGAEGVDAAMRARDRLVGKPQGPRALYLCHGFCELGAQPLVPVLRQIHDFLVENPGEVLVIVVEDYVAPGEIAGAFEESDLHRFVYRRPPGPPWPTLREMIDSDERVLVLGENDTAGVPWYRPAFDVVQETPYTFHAPEEFSCRPNRGGTAGSLFQINHWVETTPTPKPSNAEIVNAKDVLLARARQCQKERGKLPNILAVDFAGIGDVVAVAAELNRR